MRRFMTRPCLEGRVSHAMLSDVRWHRASAGSKHTKIRRKALRNIYSNIFFTKQSGSVCARRYMRLADSLQGLKKVNKCIFYTSKEMSFLSRKSKEIYST